MKKKKLIAVKAGAVYTYNSDVDVDKNIAPYKRHDVTVICLETKTNLEHDEFKVVIIWVSRSAEIHGLKSGDEISMKFEALENCNIIDVNIKSEMPLITEF